MKRNYYVFSNGRLRRKDNSLVFENTDGHRYVPIENIDAFYFFGEIDFNTKAINFLSQKNILIHFFNYYGYYTGTFYPREYLVSGKLLVKQVEFYKNKKKRYTLASAILTAASDNIIRNLKYYNTRGKELSGFINILEKLKARLSDYSNINELMGVEGNIHELYYNAFGKILNNPDFAFIKRSKQPPKNMLNALISFGNSLVYTTVLNEIYKSQLNPLISFLHEPGERRFSLSLDLAEIFKPLLCDRIIFKIINNNMITKKDFDKNLNYCYLTEKGRKIFLKEYDTKLMTVIKHRTLKKNVSYQYLIRLECYKIIKHLLEAKEYKGFRIWW